MKNKEVSQRNKTGFVCQGERPELSDTERDYLHLFTVEKLTVKEASIRRKCTTQNTRRYRRKLIEKGYLDARDVEVSQVSLKQGGGATWNAPEAWRLHRVHVTVQVLDGHLQRRYKSRVGTQLEVRGNTVLVHARSLEIYLGTSFLSSHPQRAAYKAAQFLLRTLRVLENDFHVLLVKDRAQNIRWAGGEYAKGNDTISTRPGAAKMRVHDSEDGRTRVLVDFSPGAIPELEFPHKGKAFGDSAKYEDFLRDVIDERYSSALCAVSAGLAATVQVQELLTERINSVAEHLHAQHKMQQGLADGLKVQVELSTRLFEALAPGCAPVVKADFSELRRWAY